MPNITLNDQQMYLLAEFAAADQSFQEASKALFAMEIDLDNADYKHASNRYHASAKTRERTAAVFASSVAADLGSEAANG